MDSWVNLTQLSKLNKWIRSAFDKEMWKIGRNTNYSDQGNNLRVNSFREHSILLKTLKTYFEADKSWAK